MKVEEAYKILTEHTRQYVPMYDSEALEVAISALERVRSIVRCEECRHSRRVENGPAAGTYRCKLTKGYLWAKDDFCSYGERKEAVTYGEVLT